MLKRILKLGKGIAKELTISFFISSLLVVICFFCFGKKIDTYISLIDMITIGKTQSEAQDLKFDSDKKRLAVYPNWGTVWATIEIPKINVSIPVYHGDTLDIIKYGVGHYSGSYFPGEGGSIILAAHNSRQHFMNLYQLAAGDIVTIKASYGTFTYRVREGKVIDYKDMSSLPIQTNKEELMMYTCWPVDTIGFKTKRYVIYAELEGATYE